MLCNPLATAIVPRIVSAARHVIHHRANPAAQVGRAHVHAHHVPGHATPVAHANVMPAPHDMMACSRVPGAPPLGSPPVGGSAAQAASAPGGPAGFPFQAGSSPGGYPGSLGGSSASTPGFSTPVFSAPGTGSGGITTIASSLAAATKAGAVVGTMAVAALGLGIVSSDMGGTPDYASSAAPYTFTAPNLLLDNQTGPSAPTFPSATPDLSPTNGASGPIPTATLVPDVPVPDKNIVEAIPEPASVILFGSGCLALMLWRRSRVSRLQALLPWPH